MENIENYINIKRIEEFIINYESGKCKNENEIFEGFQLLLDVGVLFQLDWRQGHYGRMGLMMLERGFIHIKEGLKVYDENGHEVAVGKVN